MKEAFAPRVRRLWGDEVEDRFSWLEDPESAEVISFLELENARVDAELAPLDTLKQKIFDEIRERVQETDLSVPIRKDQWEYYGRTEEGQQYGRHCRRLAAVDGGEPGPEVVILDENVLAGDSDYFDMGVFDISDDHQLCLYGIDVDGDEKYSLYLLDIEAGTTKTLPLTGVSSGSAWDNSGTSFLYLRPDETNRPAEVWHHVVGTNAADDSCVYVEPDPQFFVGLAKERDDTFVHISLGSAVTDETRLIPASDLTVEPVVVRPRQFGIEYGIAHHTDSTGQSVFYLHTNFDAKNFRLLTAPEDAVLTGEFDIGEWTEVVPNRDDVTLGGLDVFADHLVLVERSNGLLQLRVKRFSDGEEHLIEQAEEVSTVYPGANPDANTTSFRYVYASMVTPTQVCSYDLNTRTRTVLKQTPVLGGFESATYATERVWATAFDGTRIPIIMTWKRDRGEGPHPMVLYGYGSYEAAMDPSFSVARLSLLDRNFTFAVAQVRGGGELGRSWYEAAKFEHKERSFTDFVSCARNDRSRSHNTRPTRDQGRLSRRSPRRSCGQYGPGALWRSGSRGAVCRRCEHDDRHIPAAHADRMGRVGQPLGIGADLPSDDGVLPV